MKLLNRNIRTYVYPALCFFFGSIVTLSVMQIDSNNCMAEMLKEENYKYYRVSKLDNPALIIIIVSSPNNFDRRSTIRDTWLSLHVNKKSDVRIKHYFVVGSIGLSTDTMLHLSSEQSKYNDLLIFPLEDKYTALTNKVLQSYVWLHDQISYGLNFSFVLKCDDDTFIRLDLLTKDIEKFLLNYGKEAKNVNFNSNALNRSVFSVHSQVNAGSSKQQRHLYWGYFNGNAKIKTQGKWRETDWILCDNYLPYALGGGYVLSQGLISYLARNSEDLKLFKSEDVSIGAWLAPVANIDRIHDIRFNTEWNSRGCLNMYLVYHKISMTEMRTMFANIKEQGKPCVEETVRRKHYLYDWNVVPSKCCTKK